MQEYLRRLLKDKARLRKWKRVMIALSCIVVVCTVYALSLPAQTLACDKEEHTHTAECYDENNQLICEKEEHTHTDDCNKQEEVNEQEEVVKDEPETQNNDEQVSQASEEEETTTTTEPFDLNSHSKSIKSIKFTYKQNNVDKTIESGGTVSNADNTDITITVNCNSISVETLKSCGGQITYQLPDVFRIIDTTVSNITETNSSNKIGTIQANSDGKVFVTYDMDYLNSLQKGSTIDDANFFVSTQIKLERLTSGGLATVKTPIGDIYLNYGADYYEHYGKLSVVEKKSYKEDKSCEYIKYTIKLTAGVDGLKNVYVVDKFTENWDVVDYVGIEQNPVELKGKENEKDPFETITDGLTHGKIYLTNKSDDKIPDIVTGNLEDHKSFVWSIETMKPNEERILTYYVKLKDTGGKINTNNNQIIKNQSNVYSKNNQKIYDKGSSEPEFRPHIDYSMNKEKLEQSQDKNGVYTIKYKLSFKLNESSNYPLKDFVFWDYLNQTNGAITSKQYVEYDESSIELFDGSNQKISKNNYQVLWANRDDKEYGSYKKESIRFQVKGTNNNPIVMNPGDSYYVTYSVKVNPEVYAVMKSDSVDIKNQYHASSSNACDGEDWGMINKRNITVTLNDYNWVNKTLNQKKVETDTTITMDGDRYIDLLKNNSDSQFKVSKGSYKYTVTLNKPKNKNMALFDITRVDLTDTLNSRLNGVMKYVGYAKIIAYDDKENKEIGTKWIKIDNKTSFTLKLSDIGWEKNTYSYTFEYYAKPISLEDISSVDVTNTFTLNGQVSKGTSTFEFNNVNSNNTVHLTGSYNLEVNKIAWYCERPKEDNNGVHYWVIKVNGTKIRKGTKIKDSLPNDSNSYLRDDSLVGIYKGNLEDSYFSKNRDVKTLDSKSLEVVTNRFNTTYSNSLNYSNGYKSELVLEANEQINLAESERIYIVVKTEPKIVPSEYRQKIVYKNNVSLKDLQEDNFGNVQSATQNLYGGPDILKELGQTFSYDGTTVKNLDRGKDNGDTNKIKTDLLGSSRGVYASWAFKLNLAGELKGDYRVLEDIPQGMDLEYIRIKWLAPKAKSVVSKEITNIDTTQWKIETKTAPDDDNQSQTTIYYIKKDKRQALIKLANLIDGREEDQFAVDVQVVCRVTDPEVLLGGKSVTFTNNVTLQNDDGSKTFEKATSDATISDLNLTKRNLSIEGNKLTTGQKINYEIVANPKGQKLLKNTNDKLVLVDELGENLSFDSDSFTAINTRNNASVTIKPKFDPIHNSVEIEIPDGEPIKITYTAILNAPPKEKVDLNNNVYWKSYKNDKVKVTNEMVSYSISTGGSSGTSQHPVLTIKKIDLDDTKNKISGVKFSLSRCELKNEQIEYATSQPKIGALETSEEGFVKVPTELCTMEFNTIYEVKEVQAAQGYIQDKNPYYIMCAKADDSGNYPETVKEYIDFCKGKDRLRYKVVYNSSDFVLEVYNAQMGITVQKAFTNNAAETEHNPVSGTYRFGLYDNAEGTGDPLQTIEIEYGPNDTGVKSAKFRNPDNLGGTYYVFELDNKQPIPASSEANINSMQYKVVYNNKTNNTKTNSAKVGDTVTVTNKSRTKILPSTGSIGTLIYRLIGATLVVASLICLSNINKNNRKEKRRKR